MKRLAAAYRNDDFQFVAIGKQTLIKLSARKDFSVTFHGYAPVAKLHLIEQFGDVDRSIEVAHHPVDRY